MRRGGWGTALALGLFATLVSAVHPALLIAVPMALLLIALPPWRSPYRIVGLVIIALLLAGPPDGPLWYAERGWTLVLGGTFLAIVALRPGGEFLPRGIAALGATSVVGALVLAATGGWSSVEWSVARRYREAATFWAARMDTAGDPAVADMADTFRRVADLEVLLYPAMLGLASLAGLAVAWWGYGRLAGRDGALAPIREFAFTDHLVWLLVAGAALLIAPLGEMATRAGANLAMFMAGLYVLRGAAIVLALSGVSGLSAVLLGVLTVLLLPLVATAALVIGLSDTWLDLRRRGASGGPASS